MRFAWSLGPNPRQPTVLCRRRDAPPVDHASGAQQRSCTAVSLHKSSIALLLLAVAKNFLNLETINLKLEIEPHNTR